MLPCVSGSFLPLLFQPVAVLLRDTSKGWGQGGSFTSTPGKAAWVGRAHLGRVLEGLAFDSASQGAVVGCAGCRSLGSSPACHQQTTSGRRTARVAEPACAWQELSLLFAREEIKTNGALAIATLPARRT